MSDLISRQAAIDALKEHRALYCDNTPDTFSKLSYTEKSRVDELDTAIATLVNLPPAEPKRGKWIDKGVYTYVDDHRHLYKCDQCGNGWLDTPDFCPNCGAKMEVDHESN